MKAILTDSAKPPFHWCPSPNSSCGTFQLHTKWRMTTAVCIKVLLLKRSRGVTDGITRRAKQCDFEQNAAKRLKKLLFYKKLHLVWQRLTLLPVFYSWKTKPFQSTHVNQARLTRLTVRFFSCVPGVPKKVYSSFLGKNEVNVY